MSGPAIFCKYCAISSVLLFISFAWGQAPPRFLVNTLAGNGMLPFPPDGTPAGQVHLVMPQGVAVDTAGNVYVSERYYHRVIKITPGGTVTTVAGTGVVGYNGDRIPANRAQLNQPWALAFDGAGNLYISDVVDLRVRRVSAADGTITTFAGTGRAGNTGNEGPAASAPVGGIAGMVFDPQGNLFISDYSNNVIRRIDAQGIIHAHAGSGQPGFLDGPAATAKFNNPHGVAVDAQGNLYVADYFNQRIRKITPAGTVSTFAGDGKPGLSPEGSQVSAAEFAFPEALAVHNNTLYISDVSNSRVRAAALSNNTITTAVGGGTGSTLDGGQPTQVFLGVPGGIAFNAAGDMYVAGVLNRVLIKLPNVPAPLLSQIAGPGGSTPGDGGPGTSAYLLSPYGVTADADGNVYVSDQVEQRVRRIAPDGTISAFAGTGVYGFTGDGQQAKTAALAQPRGLGLDNHGNLYVTTTAGSRIRKIAPEGIINTVAGGATLGYGGDKGPAISATFDFPAGLTVDQYGNIYIADTNNNAIRIITPDNKVDTFAGTTDQTYGGDGGPARKAQLNLPRGMATDPQGDLYIADTSNFRVRKVTADGSTITTVAGGGTTNADGIQATAASIGTPLAVAFDPASGNLYFTEGTSRVRVVMPDGTIQTVANTTNANGFSGDGGPATAALFDGVQGIAAGAGGSLFVVDGNNERIRVLQPVQLFAQDVVNAASLLPGAIAPGEVVTTNCAGMLLADDNGQIDTSQLQITFDGNASPVVSAQGSQVTAIVPFAEDGNANAQLQISYRGQTSNTVTLNVAHTAPGVFTVSGSTGQAQVINADGTRNSPSYPATQGSTVTIVVTGGGQTSPPGVDGQVAADSSALLVAQATVQIGGHDAPVSGTGGIAGMLAGYTGVSVTVPAVSGAALPVVVNIGGVSSQAKVTMAVQ